MSHYVAGFYGHHPGFCNMVINTAFSLAAALFVFIILPAGDFILGEEPPEAVSAPHTIICFPLVSVSRLCHCLHEQ